MVHLLLLDLSWEEDWGSDAYGWEEDWGSDALGDGASSGLSLRLRNLVVSNIAMSGVAFYIMV